MYCHTAIGLSTSQALAHTMLLWWFQWYSMKKYNENIISQRNESNEVLLRYTPNLLLMISNSTQVIMTNHYPSITYGKMSAVSFLKKILKFGDAIEERSQSGFFSLENIRNTYFFPCHHEYSENEKKNSKCYSSKVNDLWHFYDEFGKRASTLHVDKFGSFNINVKNVCPFERYY